MHKLGTMMVKIAMVHATMPGANCVGKGYHGKRVGNHYHTLLIMVHTVLPWELAW